MVIIENHGNGKQFLKVETVRAEKSAMAARNTSKTFSRNASLRISADRHTQSTKLFLTMNLLRTSECFIIF